ncbi:MAG: endolytic transglycosylase MltG [Clostridiales bacterium]|nr:endolytic transglycosylase MltG [Clostridiales bacterium]
MKAFIGGKLKPILIIVAAVVVLLTAMIIIYLSGIGAVDGDSKKSIGVNVPSGSGASAIVEILDEEGLVKNKTCAKIHARIGRYNSLQANSYVFSKSMTLPEMFRAINEGDFQYVSKEKVVIREGLTIPQAADSMAEELPFSRDEILAKWSDKAYLNELIEKYWFVTDAILDKDIMYPLEGYLYPETYFITGDEPTIESVTAVMLDKMDQELTSRKKEIKKSEMDIHQILTMASIVERESGNVSEEMPKVAGVFFNRLDKGMLLGSDVTVCYANNVTSLELTQSQLNIDSKYNTRKNPGLPVGPICAVNNNAIDSVLNYENSDYLFFFACEDGTIIYSKTNEEHEKAVEENKWY